MAKNAIRALPLAAAAARRLCTASPAAAANLNPPWDRKPSFRSRKTNLKPLFHRLSALRTAPAGSVARTMDECVKDGKIWKEFGLINIVRELRKYKAYKLALELMDWMETRGVNMLASNSAVRLDLIATVKGIDFAESYFSGLPDSEKDLRTYSALFNSYCHNRMEDKAIALYHKMKELNFFSSSLVHNSLMTLYLKLGHHGKVQALFQEMKANNISPDSCTYNILITSWASLDDIESVEKIIQEMLVRGVAVDWSIYVNLAGVYNSAGLHEKTESVLKKAEVLMDRSNREAFHYLISLHAGAGNFAEVNRVWKSLKTTFTVTTNRSYSVMLRALSKLDDMDALKQCFEEWESAYLNYDIKLINVMIGAYLRKDMVKEAESLCRKATEKGVGSDVRTLELFMDYFLKRHEMDGALKCFEAAASQVKQSWWKPGKEKLTAFLKYFQEAKDVDGAESFCKRLKKLHCLDREAYESLVRTYVASGKKEPLLYKRIKEDGIKMSYECEKLVHAVCMTD